MGLLLPPSPAAAGVALDWQGKDAGIMLDGPITAETSFEVGWALTEISARHGDVLAFTLNSPGGSVVEASRIADTIRRIGRPVLVLSGTICASACFLLLAAAREKVVSPDALVGIHSAHDRQGNEDMTTLGVTAWMARQAALYGVPDAILGELVRTPGSGLARLTQAQVRSLPGAQVAQSIAYSQFVRSAVPIGLTIAGYSAGAAMAAGVSSHSGCEDFEDPKFRSGCRQGLHDAPPEGWARSYLNPFVLSKTNQRR